jgi:ribosome maturation factor RimP
VNLNDSIRKSEAETNLLALCDEALKDSDFRVLDVDIASPSLMRIFIDKVGTEKGPSLDEIAELSRKLDPLIEAADFTKSSYNLEVSSPGLDRRLRLVADFEKEIGNEVSLNLYESLPGIGANVKGELVKVERGRLSMAQGKKNRKEFEVSLENIKRANRVWNFEVNEKK